MAKNNKITISVNIDSVLAELVKEQAEKANRSVSNMFECILKEHFAKRYNKYGGTKNESV